MNQTGSQKKIDIGAASQSLKFEEPIDPPPPDEMPEDQSASEPRMATRAGVGGAEKVDTKRLLVLGGGLAVAIAFFVFTALAGKTPKKPSTPSVAAAANKQAVGASPKGSVTPLMDSEHPAATADNTSGQLQPNDIRRTRNPGQGMNASHAPNPPRDVVADSAPAPASLGAIPSFGDTQQHWQEPSATDATASNVTLSRPTRDNQQQNEMKENSLVFVRAAIQNPASSSSQASTVNLSDRPLLQIISGTRVQAKLQTQISSAVQAPVVAVVEYTYALGDKVIIPAGARVYGQLQQADRSGLIGVKFDEIELLDGQREKIEAIGAGLDLGPIKGDVTGKNTGRNILVRAATGMGSLLAELAGNNNSGAFSEDDMLRERLATNIGSAGDAQILSLNANSRVVVSVPADTKIYIVFTKHEQETATLRKIDHD